jgi:hypothetical protein
MSPARGSQVLGGYMDAGTRSSIIDNRDDNTMLHALGTMSVDGRTLDIVIALIALDGLHLLADILAGYERVRILFGDDANAVQRRELMELLHKPSDAGLLKQRLSHPTLEPLRRVPALYGF